MGSDCIPSGGNVCSLCSRIMANLVPNIPLDGFPVKISETPLDGANGIDFEKKTAKRIANDE